MEQKFGRSIALNLIITLEDPSFLMRPFKYAFALSRGTGGVEPEYEYCNPEAGRNEVYFAYPGAKYQED